MSQLNLTQTDGVFIRINYWDGDVRDRKISNTQKAHAAAKEASLEIKADIDVCRGATVLATYRNGIAVYGGEEVARG